MSRVMHFEINVPNPEEVTDFYEGVFGWQIEKWEGPEPYWLITTGEEGQPGINGGIMRSQDGQPRTVNTVEVDSIDAYSAKVEQNGGRVVMPKMAIPTIGWQAYVTDPQGVLFGLHQPDPEAK